MDLVLFCWCVLHRGRSVAIRPLLSAPFTLFDNNLHVNMFITIITVTIYSLRKFSNNNNLIVVEDQFFRADVFVLLVMSQRRLKPE